MVWYVPPLSPLVRNVESLQGDIDDPEMMRVPLTYLANLLTAGDERPIRLALRRLSALRSYMRTQRVEGKSEASLLEQVGMTAEEAEEMYRLLALCRYTDRFVVPTVKREELQNLHHGQGAAGYPNH
jgi:nitrate reductase beta subunit